MIVIMEVSIPHDRDNVPVHIVEEVMKTKASYALSIVPPNHWYVTKELGSMEEYEKIKADLQGKLKDYPGRSDIRLSWHNKI